VNGKTVEMPYVTSAQAMKVTATGITAA